MYLNLKMNTCKETATKFGPFYFGFNIKSIPFKIYLGKLPNLKYTIPQLKLGSTKEVNTWRLFCIIGVFIRLTILFALLVEDFESVYTGIDKRTQVYAFLCPRAICTYFHIHLLCNYRWILSFFNAVVKFSYETG